MGKFLTEFKEFAMKGNVIDMAVGVIIGGAFGKIVTSLVNDVIMPVVGVATGGLDFKEHKWILKEAVMNGDEIVSPEVAMTYGMFIQNIVDFIIVAFCIFMAIRIISKMKKQAEEAPAPDPAPSQEEVLLTEIRDLLKQQNEIKK
ncbi:MAG: large-conductance mechanosensitive channel protein MscL [Bacteroides sp.]|nr:large-conductance mechanosensitive channel protein MscL [Bacteroides sp.]